MAASFSFSYLPFSCRLKFLPLFPLFTTWLLKFLFFPFKLVTFSLTFLPSLFSYRLSSPSSPFFLCSPPSSACFTITSYFPLSPCCLPFSLILLSPSPFFTLSPSLFSPPSRSAFLCLALFLPHCTTHSPTCCSQHLEPPL